MLGCKGWRLSYLESSYLAWNCLAAVRYQACKSHPTHQFQLLTFCAFGMSKKWVGFNKVVFFSQKKEGCNWYIFYEFTLWNKLLNIIVFWFCLRFVMCRKYGGKEDLSGSLYINTLIQTVKLMTQKNRILETLKVSLTLTLLPSMIAQTKIFMRILRQR